MTFSLLPDPGLVRVLSPANRAVTGLLAITSSKWLIKLFLSSLLSLTVLAANAQTNWTNQHQTPNLSLADVAYGAGRYVAVGGDGGGILRSSVDGVTWITLNDPSSPVLFGVVYATGKFVVVGGSGTVRTSTDGLTWTTQVSGTNKFLINITYGGGQFMAVGYGGTAITSTDGVTWTPLTTGTSVDLIAITYGSNQFVIVGTDGLIRTTPNGIIWTARVSNTNLSLASVTVGPTGLFVATGFSSIIVTSPDGITWTKRLAAGFGDLLGGVACNPTTGQFVAVSNHGNDILTSPDGISWSPTYSGTQLSLSGVRYVNGKFIAVGLNACIRSSLNGMNWKPMTLDNDIQFRGAAYGNGHFVAVGNYPISLHPAIGTVAATSTDGMNFTVGTTQHSSGASEGFNDVVFANGQFVAVGGLGLVQTSVDGQQWTIRYLDPQTEFYGIAFGGGQYVAVGSVSSGVFARSTDGLTWTTGATGPNNTPNFLSGITYAQGQFLAVGYNGTIGTSPDGSVWTARTSGTTKYLKSVAYGNGTYVAVGLGGIAIKSADGITWTTIPAFTGSDVNHIIVDNGQFVSVGEDGEVFTSPNGVTWTERQTSTDGFKLNSIVHGNGLFVAVGDGGTVVTSPDDGSSPPPPPGSFAITGANTVSCQTVTASQRTLVFTPAYSGQNGQTITTSVVNEMVPTTNPGPYTLTMYIDNPVITLRATQNGTPGEATFVYNWLAVCGGGSPPPPPPPVGDFAITGVNGVNCQAISLTQRMLTFTPQYAGTNGQPVSFLVVNEMVPTTNPGPYTLTMYTDNPVITLKAVQSGTPGEASFTYNWLLAACTGNARLSAEPETELAVQVLGNPAQHTVTVSVTGVNGDVLSLSLTDMSGHTLGQRHTEQAGGSEQYVFDVSNQPAGILLLRVNTSSQTKTTRVLKVN